MAKKKHQEDISSENVAAAWRNMWRNIENNAAKWRWHIKNRREKRKKYRKYRKSVAIISK